MAGTTAVQSGYPGRRRWGPGLVFRSVPSLWINSVISGLFVRRPHTIELNQRGFNVFWWHSGGQMAGGSKTNPKKYRPLVAIDGMSADTPELRARFSYKTSP